jgi:hypothetical protein
MGYFLNGGTRRNIKLRSHDGRRTDFMIRGGSSVTLFPKALDFLVHQFADAVFG